MKKAEFVSVALLISIGIGLVGGEAAFGVGLIWTGVMYFAGRYFDFIE